MSKDTFLVKKQFEQECGISGYFSETPGIKGSLRRTPEDFVVWELDSAGKRVTEHYIPQETGGLFSTFVLKKTNLDTPTALNRLSSTLNHPLNAFGYAGLKDARAVTYQRVSVWDISPDKFKHLSLKGIEIFNPVRTVFGITLGSLCGNEFQITVSEISCSPEDTISRINRIRQELIEAGGVPNFFGMQRFGEKRPISHLIGRALIEGHPQEAASLYLTRTSVLEHPQLQQCRQRLKETWDLKEFLRCIPPRYEYEKILAHYLLKRPGDPWGAIRSLPRGIVKLFLHAFQSYLFNRMLSALLRSSECISPDLNIPLPGLGTEISSFNAPIRGILQKILEEECLSLEQFEMTPLNIRLRGIRRAALVQPRNLTHIIHEGGDVIFHFSLPAGSYATSILREFMKW